MSTEPLGVLAGAQDSFGVSPNAPANEWPFNLLSQKAVRFASGRIGRPGDDLPAADPAEQAACDAISGKAAGVVRKMTFRPASAAVEAFRLPLLPGEPAPTEITAELIRHRFGGTLHPWAAVVVTPLADANGYQLSRTFFGITPTRPGSHDAAWGKVRNWFEEHAELTGRGWAVEVADAGTYGTQAVRRVVGLTAAGRVVGAATGGPRPDSARTTPAEQYAMCREHELVSFRHWLAVGTGRTVARVILRSFAPALMTWADGSWVERTRVAAKRMREPLRPAYWRSEFHKLPAEREVALSVAWEGVQRCITGGRWDSHWQQEPRPYLDIWSEIDEREPLGDQFSLYAPDVVKRTADWFAAHSEAWLKGKYADLRATDYAPSVGEADWKTVAEVYRQTVAFYADAAAKGLAVVSEITSRTDAEISAETANPVPAAKKGKGKKGGCAADESLVAPLVACMDAHGVEGDSEWPRCDLAPQLVRFGCGRIAREGEEVEHNHPKGEVDRISELAAEAERRLAGCVPDYDQRGPFLAFYAAANKGDDVPEEFTEEFVREVLFNGTINPECGVSIGPITAGELWYEGSVTVAEFVPWFTSQPGLHAHAFISIGLDDGHGGATHPRLAVALTEKGSVVGVCGYVVWA